jgi:hypothetical protein
MMLVLLNRRIRLVVGPATVIAVIVLIALVRIHIEDEVYFSDGHIHVRISSHWNGDQTARVRIDNGDGWTGTFRAAASVGRFGDQQFSLEIRPEWDAVLVESKGHSRILHRFDIDTATELRRRWCTAAQAGPAAFQASFDARELLEPDLFWFAIGAHFPARRYQVTNRMARLRPDLSCPELQQLWASDYDRTSQSKEVGCGQEGRLTRDAEQCIAASNEDCLASEVCTMEGRCFAVHGACVAEREDDCRRSLACRLRGQCSFQSGRCVVAESEDCAASSRCIHSGDCEFDSERARCVPTDDVHCSGAIRCAMRGECDFDGAHCVSSALKSAVE